MTVADVITVVQSRQSNRTPAPRTVLELFKPVTWFPPMWAFSCGVVSSGVSLASHWGLLALGVMLTGPLVCGTSQAVNDWFDRHVDAINEPGRPIPSGRMPGTWGLTLAVCGTLVSLIVGLQLGFAALAATMLALVFAWIYSAPPLRLKNNGWWGNAAVGFTYEGLAWVTGAALMLDGAVPPPAILAAAVLYSIGAHGIMTLNDFKSIEGDLRMGIGSLPARLGAERAAKVACGVMLAPQVIVIAMLALGGHPVAALLVTGVAIAQVPLMRRLLQRPRELAPWYNQTGISLYVSGMMITAVALGSAR
jgi:chlorophyll synthase